MKCSALFLTPWFNASQRYFYRYRIRLPTGKELEMVVSKEVRKLRDFETALLKYYQVNCFLVVNSVIFGRMRLDVKPESCVHCGLDALL